MVDLHSILATHNSKTKRKEKDDEVKVEKTPKRDKVSFSEIPDVFFDEIIVNYKLSRVEIMTLMYLYRHVWCRPNLYRVYGLSQILSHTEIANNLRLTIDDVYQALRKLEKLDFIETIRSGQYFVRRYFTPENDMFYNQTYDDF